VELLGESPDIDLEDVIEEWNPPTPNTPFWDKRGLRTILGSDVGSLDGERALARRIQVITSMAALCEDANRPVAESHSTKQSGGDRQRCSASRRRRH
jgi:hypothetical protein